MWYTQREAVHRFSAWFCGLGVAQIFGGLVSFVSRFMLYEGTSRYNNLLQGFQHVTRDSLVGWRIMFIFLGTLTAFLGILAIVIMPDNPMSAGCLTEAEKNMQFSVSLSIKPEYRIDISNCLTLKN